MAYESSKPLHKKCVALAVEEIYVNGDPFNRRVCRSCRRWFKKVVDKLYPLEV